LPDSSRAGCRPLRKVRDLLMAKTTRVRMNLVNGSCSVFVQGMEMNCPLCRVLVRSGEHHECKRETAKKGKR
jgi:hypothetical protein